jgi:hypothetical protein
VPSAWPQVDLGEKRGNTVTNLFLVFATVASRKKLEIETYFFRHKSAGDIYVFKTKDLCVRNFSRKILFVSGKYLLSKKHGRRLLFYKAAPPPSSIFCPLAQALQKLKRYGQGVFVYIFHV